MWCWLMNKAGAEDYCFVDYIFISLFLKKEILCLLVIIIKKRPYYMEKKSFTKTQHNLMIIPNSHKTIFQEFDEL